MTSRSTRNEHGFRNPLLGDLMGLDPVAGLVYQDGPASLAKRMIGTGASDYIPTYGDMISYVGVPPSTTAIDNGDSPYTVVAADYTILVDASGGAVTVTLPAASSSLGRVLSIKAIDVSGGSVTIDGDGSETIDSATTQVISAQYDVITVQCDGTQWWLI